MSDIKTNVRFVPDFDSSSMRGFTPGMTNEEVTALLTGRAPAAPAAEAQAHDVDSSSMRGFTIGGGPALRNL